MLRIRPGYARRLGVPTVAAMLRQLDGRNQGIERAGLTGRAYAPERASPEHAVFMVVAGVVSLDGLGLTGEEGVEPRRRRRDREDLEVADKDALEGLGISVESGGADALLAGFGQHPTRGELADRGCRDALGRAQERAVPGGPVELGKAGQDYALVIGPGDVAVVRARAVEAVVDHAVRVDQPAVVEPRPLGLRPAQVLGISG